MSSSRVKNHWSASVSLWLSIEIVILTEPLQNLHERHNSAVKSCLFITQSGTVDDATRKRCAKGANLG